MADETSPMGAPHAQLLRKIAADAADQAIARGGGGGHGNDMDDAWRSSVDGRLTGLERETHGIKSAMDWMKVAFTMLIGIVALVAAAMWNVSGKLDGLSSKLSDEFRSQRSEMSAQTSAIANAVTAAKQQPPQVLLVPSPLVSPPASKQKP